MIVDGDGINVKPQSFYVMDDGELLHLKAVDSGRERAFAERREVKQSRQKYCISHGGTQQL